jgi:hypothetical protein
MLWLQGTGLEPASSIDTRIKVVVAVVGLTGSVIPVLVGWFKDRDQSVQRVRQIEEATKTVVFWDSWLKSIVSANPEVNGTEWKSIATEQFLYASTLISSSLAIRQSAQKTNYAKQAFESHRRSLPWLRRWLLLYYPPRARAWLPRALFYLFLLFVLVGTLGELSPTLSPPSERAGSQMPITICISATKLR